MFFVFLWCVDKDKELLYTIVLAYNLTIGLINVLKEVRFHEGQLQASQPMSTRIVIFHIHIYYALAYWYEDSRARICRHLRSLGIDSWFLQPSLCSLAESIRQKELSYRPARLHRLAESIPWNRFLGSLNVYQFGLWSYTLRLPVEPAHFSNVVKILDYIFVFLLNLIMESVQRK